MATSKIASVLSTVLGLVFVGPGAAKICEWREILPANLKLEFVKFAQVFPLRPLGFVPDPVTYMVSIGIIEVVLGTVLMLGSTRAKRASCLGLMVIMAGATQTLICVQEWKMVIVPSSVFFGLLWTYFKLGTLHTDTKKSD